MLVLCKSETVDSTLQNNMFVPGDVFTGTLSISDVSKDTYIDLSTWGKGFVYGKLFFEKYLSLNDYPDSRN